MRPALARDGKPERAASLLLVLLDKPNRNALFEVIKKEGFDPRDFELTHNETQFVLVHRSWSGWFRINESPKGLIVGHQVGDAKPEMTGLGRPETAPPVLSRWLQDMKIDHETPDLWEGVANESRMSELVAGQQNTPFTAPEQDQIAAIVADVLKQASEEFELSEGELRELTTTLDYVSDAATWIRGRVDWVQLVAGAVFNKVAEGVLTPDTMHSVLHALTAGLGPVFGHPLPMIGP